MSDKPFSSMSFDDRMAARIEGAKARREGRAPGTFEQLVETVQGAEVRYQVKREMARFRMHQAVGTALGLLFVYAVYRWQERHSG